MHNHDKGSEACLNRKILNNSVKRTAMEDLCERPCKLIHKELQSQDLDTLTCKDIRDISMDIHHTRFSQPIPLRTDTEETHGSLNAVQVLTSSKGQFLFVTHSEKNTVIFSSKPAYSILAPLMCLTFRAEVFPPRKTIKLKNHYISTVYECLFNTCAKYIQCIFGVFLLYIHSDPPILSRPSSQSAT